VNTSHVGPPHPWSAAFEQDTRPGPLTTQQVGNRLHDALNLRLTWLKLTISPTGWSVAFTI